MNIDFIKIINEEINKFDFLGNDEFLKEQEITDLLLNEDLQKQFICDSLLNRNDKIKITKIIDSHVTGNWDEPNPEDANRLSMIYMLGVEYTYDSNKEPLKFKLNFDSDKIDISVAGWYDAGSFGNYVPPEGDSWYDRFDWSDINVSLHTIDDDDEIKFAAFINAPPKIQILFIRDYTQNFIENETMEIRTKEMKDNVRNTPYC